MSIFVLCLSLFLGLTPQGSTAKSEAAARAQGFPRYELDIELDPERHHLQGRCTLTIPAAENPREFIKIGLGKNMRDLAVEVVEPKECAGPITLEPQLDLSRNSTWNARPVKPFPANRAVQLRASWQGGEKPSFVFYIGPEGSFLSGINTAWYPVIETGLGTGKLRVTVPAGLLVHANGLQRGSVAQRERGIFEYEAVVPSFFALVAGRYTVARSEGAIPVSVYMLRPRTDVDEYIDGCRKSIKVLSDEFGPYPSGEFAIVEVPQAQAGAAGFAGASVASFIMVTGSFLDQRFNLAYYGHEISHQWWGNLIRLSGQRGRMMLDEAMAQYGSLRAVETIEGEDAAERYRRTGYPGYIESQSGLGYLKVLASGKDFPLSNIPNNASRSLADGKGFQVWGMLSLTLGRDNFRKILRTFTKEHTFQRVTWDEFLQDVERGAGRDLGWFYEQWFDRTGVPDWQLSWRQEGPRVRGEITQEPPYFRATLEVLAEGPDGEKHSEKIEVDGARTEFTLPLKFSAARVVLDPHFRVLRWTPEYREAVRQAAAPAPFSAAEQELFSLEEELVDAVKRGDRELLQRVVADDFRQTGLFDWSRPLNKAQWIDNAMNIMARLRAPVFSFRNASVRIHGVTGTVNTLFAIRQTGAEEGEEIRYAILDVWSKETGKWLLVSRHIERKPDK